MHHHRGEKGVRKLLTLCIIHQEPRVLLGMKKRGFGEGRWNGFGGKVAPGETIEDAARREVLEEAGIDVQDLEEAGILEFEFRGEPDVLEVHIFRTQSFTGTPRETDEMRPQWFRQEDIPFDAMWPDDALWFPMFLQGELIRGKFLFEGHDTILEYSLH